MGEELKTPTRALVNIQVVWKGQKVPVDLRMIKRKGLWKVYDIQFLGISAVRNYRAQFQFILRKETPESGNRKVETENRADRTKATEGGRRSPRFFFANMNKYCYLASSNAILIAAQIMRALRPAVQSPL